MIFIHAFEVVVGLIILVMIARICDLLSQINTNVKNYLGKIRMFFFSVATEIFWTRFIC